MMRTAAPIRVPESRRPRSTQQVRTNPSNKRQLSHFLPVLSLMLTACGAAQIGLVTVMVFCVIFLGLSALVHLYDRDMPQDKPSDVDPKREQKILWRRDGMMKREIGLGTETTKPPVNIDMLRNEDSLLNCLRRGNKIAVYRGFHPEHPPEIGQEYTRRSFSHCRAEVLENNPKEQIIEEVRQEHFANSPSRLDSVFATNYVADAEKYGDVYKLEISLRPEAAGSQRLPVRWLDRDTFDFMQMASFSVEESRDFLMETAQDYWAESGSHQVISDILLDPTLVEIRVVKRV